MSGEYLEIISCGYLQMPLQLSPLNHWRRTGDHTTEKLMFGIGNVTLFIERHHVGYISKYLLVYWLNEKMRVTSLAANLTTLFMQMIYVRTKEYSIVSFSFGAKYMGKLPNASFELLSW